MLTKMFEWEKCTLFFKITNIVQYSVMQYFQDNAKKNVDALVVLL